MSDPVTADLRAALRLVTASPDLRVPKNASALLDEARQQADAWVRDPGIQGFGISRRRAGGGRTSDPALTVYVEEKVPLDALANPVPRSLWLPWSQAFVPTDVVAIGRLHLQQALTGAFNPAMPGCAVSIPGRPYGTFGCLVREPVEGGAFYVLSAAHVIALRAAPTADPNDLGPVGIPLLQPGVAPSPSRLIGQLVRWGGLTFTPDTFPNLFDAALAAVDSSEVRPDIGIPGMGGIGRPRGFSTTIFDGMPVKKVGATTGHTRSVVRDSNFHCKFHYRLPNGTSARAGFQQQVLCDDFSDGGDSGAAVLNDANEVVGLLIGSASGGTVFSPISPILTRFGVALA